MRARILRLAHPAALACGAAASAAATALANRQRSCCSAACPSQPLLERRRPFTAASLEGLVDHSDVTYAELKQGTELASLAAKFFAENGGSCSFRLDASHPSAAERTRETLACSMHDSPVRPALTSPRRRTRVRLGYGLFQAEWQGHRVLLLHQTVGAPKGTVNGVDMHSDLILLTPGSQKLHVLAAFCDELLARSDATDPAIVKLYRFKGRWRQKTVIAARAMESVVLPSAVKRRVLDELDDFFEPSTVEFYARHGIPYKRSLLFHGLPGSGKTSLVQALAGRYGLGVCYLSPTEEDMTDASLKDALQELPAKSLVVIEDVDALFSKTRQRKVSNQITFSGLLNALDGIGSPAGQLVVLTTNHRDQLDAALIRNGRVDTHVPFTYADDEQMRLLFRQFYPAADEVLAAQFAEGVLAALSGRRVSMSVLQHHFIANRKQPAEHAAQSAHLILEELLLREDEPSFSL